MSDGAGPLTMLGQIVVSLVSARQRAKARRMERDMMIAERRARAENEALRREWLERVLRQQQHGAARPNGTMRDVRRAQHNALDDRWF